MLVFEHSKVAIMLSISVLAATGPKIAPTSPAEVRPPLYSMPYFFRISSSCGSMDVIQR